MSISDLEDKSKEAELRGFDADRNGLLSQDEAYNYIVSKRPDQAGKKQEDVLSQFDVYEVAGTKPKYPMKPSAWRAPTPVRWKGNFQVPGLGLGHVRTEQNTDDQGRPQITFNVDCHGMKLDELKEFPVVTLVLGRSGFEKEEGSELPEQIVVELENRAPPTFNSWSGKEEPGQLLLAGSYLLEPLQKLAADAEGGLDFYLRLESPHHTKFINKDGEAGKNFAIDRTELGLLPARQDQ